MDHLEQIKSIRQQLTAALAAYPHDYDEACQRLQAADAALAVLERDGERVLAEMVAWTDAQEVAHLALIGEAK